MKSILHVAIYGIQLAVVTGIPACKTDEPGVRSTHRSQYTTVTGTTNEVAKAAEDVLEDLKLQRIETKSTAVDGYAVGYTADNKKVTVDINKQGEHTSEVRVNVGATGDPELGKDILARLQKKLAD
jgi:hypothetical protein